MMIIDDLQRWIRRWLWGLHPRPLPVEALRTLAVSVWKFNEDRGPIRAAALAFTTVLSLVPLLSLVFSVLKGIGVQRRIEPILLEYFGGANEAVINKVIEYVDRTQMTGLGIVGFATLAIAALSVMSNIERSFNAIWGVDRGRSTIRKFTDYTTLLIFCPLLLVFSTSLSTTLHVWDYMAKIDMVETARPLLLAAAPFAAKVIAFSAAYLVLPNRRVGYTAALAGGVLAAICWQATEWAYLTFEIGVARYNAIYGTLAQLPLFLVWIYSGWSIVLIGAEVACVLELPGRGRFIKGGEELWSPRLGPAVTILAEVGRRFETRARPASAQELLEDEGFHPVEGRRVLEALIQVGILARLDDEAGSLVPAVSPDTLTVGEMIARIAVPDTHPDRAELMLYRALGDAVKDETWAHWATALAGHVREGGPGGTSR